MIISIKNGDGYIGFEEIIKSPKISSFINDTHHAPDHGTISNKSFKSRTQDGKLLAGLMAELEQDPAFFDHEYTDDDGIQDDEFEDNKLLSFDGLLVDAFKKIMNECMSSIPSDVNHYA